MTTIPVRLRAPGRRRRARGLPLALLALAPLFASSGPSAAREQAGKGDETRAAPGATGGKKMDHAALAMLIDQQVRQRLTAEKVAPAPLADDAEFLRRVHLDLAGVIPSASLAAKFL